MTSEQPPLLAAPELIDTLNRHGVRYVLVGGYAAVVMGGIARATWDIDICPARNPDNLLRLKGALEELGARAWTEGGAGTELSFDIGRLKRIDLWNLTTRHGNLDILFVPKGTGGFEDLVPRAATFDIHGLQVDVVSLDDLIEMKRVSARPIDLADLFTLEELRHELARGGESPGSGLR